jgi:2-hydroxyacyl-CoA lyase 1
MSDKLNLSAEVANLSSSQRKLLQQKLEQFNCTNKLIKTVTSQANLDNNEQQILSGHEVIAQTLKQNGITHVYGISGVPIDNTLSECAKNGIRVVGVHHQQAGVMMASAQNYQQGKLAAVVILSTGPAITNAITGALVAQDNGFPVLIIGSTRALQNHGIGYFQELNGIPIVQSITKLSQLVDSTEKIADIISKGISIATEGRKGAVYLEIPEDILNRHIKLVPKKPFYLTKPTNLLDTESIAKAVPLLKNAQRPVLIVGRGVRWDNAYEELSFFVDKLGIPFTTSPMAQGFISDNHPLCYNAINAQLFSQADVIFAIGARLNWTFRFGAEFGKDAKLIQIDIHPPEIGNNLTPTVGIVGDAKSVLQKMINQLKSSQLNLSPLWLRYLHSQKEEKLKQWNLLAEDDSLPISPHRLIQEIREILPREAIITIDGNVILAATQRLLPSYLPVSRFTPGTNGCMGVGIPFAIAAKISEPQRPVLAITGDLALGMNPMEMETAIRYRLPIIIIVANNGGHGGVLTQRKFYASDYPDKVTMFEPNIHYEKIMETFGGKTEYVEVPDEIKPALKRALNNPVATCINVKINPETPYPSK